MRRVLGIQYMNLQIGIASTLYITYNKYILMEVHESIKYSRSPVAITKHMTLY